MCPVRGLRWKFIRAVIPVDLSFKTDAVSQLSVRFVLVLLSLRENPGELGSQVLPSRQLCEQGAHGKPS